ncbi:MAG: FAD-dependent oxidoreductase, partial [Clostridia bacterium]|nr:FAD-dependent oxidoreductase [Clostridia bacterium]
SLKGESVGIGRLERFVADYHMAKTDLPEVTVPPSNGHRVAVIGSGPAGLTCAGDLRKMGYDVTIFEAFHKSGGVLVYGIPQFRLPKEIVAAEIENLTKMGVKIVNNAIIGKSITVDELFEDGFEAIFIGSGAGLPQFLHIPGENLLGVYSANELLTRTNLMKAYRDDYDTPIKRFHRVAVVGAGNVAMDAARVAKRLGAEHVYITYRRGKDELPARKEEVEHAEAEGIEFNLLNNPCAIHGDESGHVTGIELIRQELGEPDEKGRRKPVAVPDSNWILDVDTVIIAIGTSPNPLIRNTTQGLEFTRKGGIQADENGVTSRPGVFAGGDAVTGSATVILAMGAGKAGAKSVLGVDISEEAVEVATENARINGLDNVRFETHNCFDHLRELTDNKEKFDVVILDPPAFTKTRAAVESALRGYKEINLRGLRLTVNGGFLVTCSCSQHVSSEQFINMINTAARDAKKRVRMVEFRTQGHDHPILPASNETQYLKCAILQVFD